MEAVFDFARRLYASSLSMGIKNTPWLPQLLQVVHLLTMGLLIGSVLIIVLRIHGRAYADEPLQQVWRRFAPWFWRALAGMACSGIIMAIAEPLREASALSFWLKMVLVLTGVAGMLRLRRIANRAEPVGPSSRHIAKLVLVAWMSVLFLGRAVGYDIPIWGSLSPRAHIQ
jgi:putative copper export protein